MSLSKDMSPYCSAHDEWLIMKLCMNVGYHDANNVSNFGGHPVTQLNVKKRFIVYLRCFTDMTLHSGGGCYATMCRLQQYERYVLSRPGSNTTAENFASELWQFRLPRFASVFRRRH